MTPIRNVAVAGAGVAGIAAADALVQAGYRVTLVADASPASTTLAALVNPFAGPRASPAWRYRDAAAALDALLERLGSALRPGLVRPALDVWQAEAFRRRAAEHPDALAWHPPGDDQPSGVAAPHGWLDVRVGGAWPDAFADLARHADRLRASGALARMSATVTGADATPSGEVRLRLMRDGHPDTLAADAVVLALGAGLATVAPAVSPPLVAHLHRVKGETFAAEHPAAHTLPALSAGGYAVAAGRARVALGGTYDHRWTDLAPDLARCEALRDRMAALLPGLGALVKGSARAGLRVQRPHLRRPLLEPVDASGRLWAFGALGAKGLLHAPLVAALLPAALHSGASTVPGDLRV